MSSESSSSSSSSSASSSVANFHCGNYYDLTTVNSDSDQDADAGGSGPSFLEKRISGQRQINEVTDDGNCRRTGVKSSTTSGSSASRGGTNSCTSNGDGSLSAPTTLTARSESRHRSVSIIDLVNDSEEETHEAVDAAGKKRSLPPPPPPQQSNFKTPWKEEFYVDEEEVDTKYSSSKFCAGHATRRKRSRIPSSSSSSYTNTINCQQIGISSSQQAVVPKSSSTTTTTKTHHYHYLDIPSRNCPRDGATITFGLLSLIDVLLKDGNATLTCEGSVASSRNKLLSKRPMMHDHPIPPVPSSPSLPSSSTAGYRYQHHHLPYNHQPFHYLQHDNWSCGYRNLQMLLSSMMPSLLPIFPRGVPCIEEIQRTMEELWSQGYDLRNAEHHKYALVGKKTWIGTVEVWSYLSFMRVDSIIVQFIKTSQNRALLGKFVWAYFNRVCHTPFGCSSCEGGHDSVQGSGGEEKDPSPLASPILTSLEYADHLLREMAQSNNNVNKGKEQRQGRCRCSIPPLYLQWEGHSVTVVGIKRTDCTRSTLYRHRPESSSSSPPPESYSLIVFCPQKKVANVKSALSKEFRSRNMILTAATAEWGTKMMVDGSSKSYPSNNELKKKGNDNIIHNSCSILELPVTKLFEKDCQILLTTGGTIDAMESKRRTVCSKEVGYLNAS